MAKVTVRVYMTEAFKEGAVSLTAATYIEALQSLVAEYPVLRGVILTGESKLRPDYIYLLNGRSVEFLGKEEAPLSDGDFIAVFPPVGGG